LARGDPRRPRSPRRAGHAAVRPAGDLRPLRAERTREPRPRGGGARARVVPAHARAPGSRREAVAARTGLRRRGEQVTARAGHHEPRGQRTGRDGRWRHPRDRGRRGLGRGGPVLARGRHGRRHGRLRQVARLRALLLDEVARGGHGPRSRDRLRHPRCGGRDGGARQRTGRGHDLHDLLSLTGITSLIRLTALGILAAGFAVALLPLPLTPEAHAAAVVFTIAVLAWVTEVVPLAATSLLIPAGLIALGATSAADAFAGFGNPLLFIFVGGFFIAEAMKR